MTNARAAGVRGGRSLLVAQVVTISLNGVALMVLSRLLTASEFGVVAAVMVVVGFADLLRSLGLGTAAIRTPDLSRNVRDNLFWINACLGFVLAIGLYIGSPGIASAYQTPAVAPVARAMAFVFAIQAMSIQHAASLTRDLRFRATAITRIIAEVSGVVAGITAAYLGLGAMSLVIRMGVTALAYAGALLVTAGWLPGWPSRDPDTAALVRFGLNVSGAKAIHYIATNIDSAIVGRVSGPVSLGFYNRAFQTVMLPAQRLLWPAYDVAFPVLASAADDPIRFHRLAVRSQRTLLVATSVAVGTVIVGAPAAVQIVLGVGWSQTIPLVRALGVAAILQAAVAQVTPLCNAIGKARQLLHFTAVTRLTQVVILLLGGIWGPLGVAVAYSVSQALIWGGTMIWLRTSINFDSQALARDGAVIMSGVTLAALAGVGLGAFVGGSVWRVSTVGCLSFAFALVAVASVVSSFRRYLLDTSQFVWQMVREPLHAFSVRRAINGE